MPRSPSHPRLMRIPWRLLQLWTAPVGVEGHARPGDCIWVHCMAVDSKGDLYAGDIMGKRAQKFVRQR